MSFIKLAFVLITGRLRPSYFRDIMNSNCQRREGHSTNHLLIFYDVMAIFLLRETPFAKTTDNRLMVSRKPHMTNNRTAFQRCFGNVNVCLSPF